MNIVTKALAATTLAATALATSAPAMAREAHHDGGDTAAIAIGAGIVGLAIGALIASDHHDHWDDRYYVRDGWYYNDGYYYNRQGLRYNRGDWNRRYGYNYNRNYRGDHYARSHRDYRSDRWTGGDRSRGHGDSYYDRRGY